MHHLSIIEPTNGVDAGTWYLTGTDVSNSEKRLKHLQGVFGDEGALKQMEPEAIVYNVQAHFPVPEGTPGGLFFGATTIQPGRVGDEYFMTRGHFHSNINRGEYYWGVQGEGILVLMNDKRETWAERMWPGSLHYIRGGIAHRVANIGVAPLVFGASWPSDAGHNYEAIARDGFSARLVRVSGKPTLVAT